MKISHLTTLPLLVALLWTAPVAAQDEVQGVACGEERQVSPGTHTEQTYRRLERIYEAIGEEEYDDAMDRLESLSGRIERQEYSLAVVRQAMGHVRMQQDRPADAIEHFKAAFDLNRLPNNQHFELILIIANIHFSLDNFGEALDGIDRWFCVVPEDDQDNEDVWIMKASIHAQLEEYREALEAVDRAIEVAEEPREQWYQLKLGMHLELSEYREGIEVLKILLPMNPDNRNYWLQMSSLYNQVGDEEQSKSVLKLAYRRGLLDRQSEFLQLASFLQSSGAPRRAAEVMMDGLDSGIVESTRRHWEMAAGAWYEARELDEALEAYEQAGAQSDDGKIDLQRGFLLVDLERYDEAEEALSRALELGGLNEGETGNAWLLLGMSRLELENFDSAIEAFNEASNYRRVSEAAREWINHAREARGRRGP